MTGFEARTHACKYVCRGSLDYTITNGPSSSSAFTRGNDDLRDPNLIGNFGWRALVLKHSSRWFLTYVGKLTIQRFRKGPKGFSDKVINQSESFAHYITFWFSSSSTKPGLGLPVGELICPKPWDAGRLRWDCPQVGNIFELFCIQVLKP